MLSPRYWLTGLRFLNKVKTRRPFRSRPSLEFLETRNVLSTFLVINPGDNGGINPAVNAGTGTLRQAIIDSNAVGGSNTILFALPALTPVNPTPQTIALGAALPTITSALTIQGPGAFYLTVSGNNATQVFSATSVSVTLDGLTVANGSALAGAGISQTGGSLTILNSDFTNNTTTGGVGGAVNFPLGAAGGTLTISDSTFTGNKGFNGGAVSAVGVAAGTVTVSRSTFAGNQATTNAGGAISTNAATTVITDSTFSSNTSAINGGAISSASGSLTITNDTFFGNTATSQVGGALVTSGAVATVTNATIVGNTATNGGGIAVTGGSLTLSNTVFFNNVGGGNADLLGVISGSSGNNWFSTDGNPNLAPLGDYGGPTQTMVFTPATPIGLTAGNPTGAPTVDQRGAPRVGGTWLGAAQGTQFVVDNTSPGIAGSLDTAILAANADGNLDAIDFNLPGAGPFIFALAAPLPDITSPVFLDGYSQPGSQKNTLTGGDNAILLIELDGKMAAGLTLASTASGSTVQGLAMSGFGSQIFIQGNGNTLRGNFLGTTAAGTLPVSQGLLGVEVAEATLNNLIGELTPEARNLISGNAVTGIQVDSGGMTSTPLVVGNFIGTDRTGNGILPGATQGQGISDAGFSSTIGGTAAGAGNVISGNTTTGISLLSSGAGALVQGNNIGMGVDGTTIVANTEGVQVNDSPNNAIGGSVRNAGNLISGNSTDGLRITGASATGNAVQGNYIGLDRTGATIASNASDGILIDGGATGNTIGALSSGIGLLGTDGFAGNLIGGNGNAGVEINANGNTLQGDYLGTDHTGTQVRGNGTDVLISGSSNTVGGSATGAGNLISGASDNGLEIDSGTGNTVQGNYIGTDLTGTATTLGNLNDGVLIKSGGNFVGGSSSSIGVLGSSAFAGNLISANANAGVEISGSTNTLRGNILGLDQTGSVPIGNAVGILISGAGNQIGDSTSGDGNIISGNAGPGVQISGAGATQNIVANNLIGTDPAHDFLASNSVGVLINKGAFSNTIGGGAGLGNLIGSNINGVEIDGSGTSGNVVAGNLIGVDASGNQVRNTNDGVLVHSGASGNFIGLPGEGNVIGDNQAEGVELDDATTTGTEVQANFIGTNASNAALGNSNGVYLYGAVNNTIGGTSADTRNIISGNKVGVNLQGGASGNVVSGDYIGVGADGTTAVPNGNGTDIGGILIFDANGNTIGGSTATPGTAAGNVISGNAGHGIYLDDPAASGNLIAGNFIGPTASGSPLGNTVDGIRFANGASGNTVGGGAGFGNVLAGNGGNGITVGANASDTTTTGDSILGNSIFGNTGLGIDLAADGHTANGANPRFFPNNGQNFPVSNSVQGNALSGTLTSSASTMFRIEFFDSPASGPAYQGETFLGFVNVTTSSSGTATFSTTFKTVPFGDIVTATATNLATGDTSEFSDASSVINIPAPPTAVSTPTPTPSPTATGATAGVFSDANLNGTQNPLAAVPVSLLGLTVFLDVNGSGSPNGNPVGSLDGNGNFVFSGLNLAPGSYTIRLLTNLPGQAATQPAGTLVVGGDGSTSDVSLGLVLYSPVAPITFGTGPERFLNTGTSSNPDADTAFLRGLYHVILGREDKYVLTDPFGTRIPELQFWLTQLHSGAMTRNQIAYAFVNSPEHRADEVACFYQTYLGRDPDPQSTVYVQMLLAGFGEAAVVESLIASVEYQGKHSSDQDFLTSLYDNVLGRLPDSDGLAFWQNKLNGGQTRAVITQEFLLGQENANRAVSGFIAAFLHQVSPQDDIWVKEIEAGRDFGLVVADILTDPFAHVFLDAAAATVH